MSLYIVAGENKVEYVCYCAWKALTDDDELYLAETRSNIFHDYMPIMHVDGLEALHQFLCDRYEKKAKHISIFLANMDYEDELLKRFLEAATVSDKMHADIFVCISKASESVINTLMKVNVVQVTANKDRVLTSRSFNYIHRKVQNDAIYQKLLRQKEENDKQ